MIIILRLILLLIVEFYCGDIVCERVEWVGFVGLGWDILFSMILCEEKWEI